MRVTRAFALLGSALLGSALFVFSPSASAVELPHENAVPGGVKILHLDSPGASMPYVDTDGHRALVIEDATNWVAVIGIPDAYRGQSAKAFIAMKPGAAPVTFDELKAFLADKLAKYEMPAQMEIRASLPKTPVGKLSKKELVAEELAKQAPAATPASG